MSTPVEQAQDEALLAENPESESSSSLSDDEEIEHDISPPAPTVDEPPVKKEKKKPETSKNQSMTFNLASTHPGWDANFMTKTDMANLVAQFRELLVSNANNGSLSLSDLELGTGKTQPKYSPMVVDEGGLNGMNLLLNLLLDVISKRANDTIHLKTGITLNDRILDGVIKASFSPEFAEIFLADMDRASQKYELHKKIPKEPQNSPVPANA